jgi:ATP diphosphatase
MKYIQKLLDVMAALRDPETGCPWDVEQDFRSIAPYTIEEAYEVADAIDREAMLDLRDELGDLLLQVVFHAQMAREAGHFEFEDVAQAIVEKMVRRHPHVFGDETVSSAQAQRRAWEQHKKNERDAKADESDGVLDGVALALPALMRAGKLGKRAASVGFDWPDATGVRTKVDEELEEFDAARERGVLSDMTDEIGDLLFSVANLARHCGIDPEESLRAANRKFTVRFNEMEHRLSEQGQAWESLTPVERENLWQAVKADE